MLGRSFKTSLAPHARDGRLTFRTPQTMCRTPAQRIRYKNTYNRYNYLGPQFAGGRLAGSGKVEFVCPVQSTQFLTTLGMQGIH